MALRCPVYPSNALRVLAGTEIRLVRRAQF